MNLFRPQTSLVLRVILATSVVLITAISLTAWLNIRFHENHITRLTYERTKIIAEFIERNVIREMERGKHFNIHRILKNFAVYEGIWKINVFRPDGVVTASTRDEELKKNVGDDMDFYLKNRYFIRREDIRQANGRLKQERIYYYVNSISNHKECFQCHDRNQKILGILTVGMSLKEEDEEISDVKKEAVILAVITIVVLSSMLVLLFLKFIRVPITKLTDAMRKAEEGDLNVRVHLRSKDEMGMLAESLNTMIEKLNAAKKEAEQYHQELVQRADRMASIGELASGIAHEIRNPLAGIQGAIQILAEGFPKEDGRKRITDEIQKQIYKLERLVKNLLDYSKPVPTNYLPTDVNELVDKVLSFFITHRGRLENFRIERRFSSPLPRVMIDPNSLEQAFLNIVLNAQNAMTQGGTLMVSTRSLSRDGDGRREVQIAFEDTGGGISEENLSKIFNPFFSTRPDGTGLGLSITKNIVEQHEGKIEVESQVNVGTKFTITLPVMK
jgi:signal transduction histidine kinase